MIQKEVKWFLQGIGIAFLFMLAVWGFCDLLSFLFQQARHFCK